MGAKATSEGSTRTNDPHKVVLSLRERLERKRYIKDNRGLAERLMEIGRRCASRPRLDSRTPDEILGYGTASPASVRAVTPPG
ncbi:MAG: type II toxin-antitoxin system VapB family antitoxin [Deltaproteobacteria bacterium]|nr:type II toxin-antitoxin system VapB family antitoxin [Deltaproteobacteria bacterium]MCB9787981.1 type II toxin-antitoxin system VapB family antitoxin [Deltaproteobacteria bacterium]